MRWSRRALRSRVNIRVALHAFIQRQRVRRRTWNQTMLIHAVTVELARAYRGQTLIGWGSVRTERKVPLHRSKQDLATPR